MHYENVELLAAGGEGHALAKIEGKVIFVKYGAPGDVVDLASAPGASRPLQAPVWRWCYK